MDIGINVTTPSHVEIALGDNRGNEILLSYGVWEELINQRDNIGCFFTNDVIEAPSQTIGHIKLSFGTINNLKVLRLETSTQCLIMSSNTVYNMISHEYCVHYIAQSLKNIIGTVDAKFTRFREIANGAVKNPIAAIRESEFFDKDNIVNCELLAQVFVLQY